MTNSSWTPRITALVALSAALSAQHDHAHDHAAHKAPAVVAAPNGVGGIQVAPRGDVITVDGESFATWTDFVQRAVYQKGLRCKTSDRNVHASFAEAPSDCGYSSNTASAEYAPSYIYDIPVVFHIIQSGSGQGFVSQAMIDSQIDILNEDFRALAGTPGAPGVDTRIQFHLATEDPNGNPTSGVTYTSNTSWFNDNGAYWNSLGWDTDRYLNVYTNKADGALGYVPDIPQGGVAGTAQDRVVMLWSTIGDNAPIGSPFDKGRTLTHEIGHYLGLYHTFDGGCGSASNCSSSGDLICDTERESSPHEGCGTGSSCGSPDPVNNYMNYSDDTCMHEFTQEQARRMRCTLQHYRPMLGGVVSDVWTSLGQSLGGSFGDPTLAADGTLEAGDTVTLSLSSARPFGSASLVIGTSQINAPFKGGVLVPSVDLVLSGLPVSAAGTMQASFAWPAGVPSDTESYYQAWIPDATGPKGLTASNALRGVAP